MKDYCMTVILWSFHCNNDNLTLMLYQENRSYPDEERFLLTNSNLEVFQERVLLL